MYLRHIGQVVLLAGGALSASAQATPVTIVNHSFEIGSTLGEGQVAATTTDGLFTGWRGGADTGRINPGPATFVGGRQAPNDTDGTPGTYMGFATSSTGDFKTDPGSLIQTLSIKLAANMRYTLSVDVGNTLNPTLPTYWFGLGVGQMMSRADIVAQQTGIENDGTYTRKTLTFETNANTAGLGNFVSIFLSSLNGSSIYDNVHLDATSIAGPVETPEPGAFALLGLGIIGVAGLRRRRSPAAARGR